MVETLGTDSINTIVNISGEQESSADHIRGSLVGTLDRSASENTFVWRGDVVGGAGAEAGDAKSTPRDDAAIGIIGCSEACGFNVAVRVEACAWLIERLVNMRIFTEISKELDSRKHL